MSLPHHNRRRALTANQRGISLLQMLLLIGLAGIVAWFLLNHFAS